MRLRKCLAGVLVAKEKEGLLRPAIHEEKRGKTGGERGNHSVGMALTGKPNTIPNSRIETYKEEGGA